MEAVPLPQGQPIMEYSTPNANEKPFVLPPEQRQEGKPFILPPAERQEGKPFIVPPGEQPAGKPLSNRRISRCNAVAAPS